ncbi:cingulin-like protein 1 [Watersipora subatra]|uniref:cingulin-like protein 1 n=1 Tax=Watersipora subatra TaxID=2589382 RepID=UPI00355BC879
MDHYKPEHPLPEEIQSMERDDTVCQFCGVSYLIHNEIKALEEKLAKVESELAVLRGSEEREKKLQSSLSTAQSSNDLLQSQLQERDKLVAMLQAELEKKDTDYISLQAEKSELADVLKSKESQCISMREDNSHLRQVLAEFLVTLKQQKEAIASTKSDMSNYISDSTSSIQLVHRTMQSSVDQLLNKEKELEERVSQLRQDVLLRDSTISTLSDQLNTEKLANSENKKLLVRISELEKEKDKAVCFMRDEREEMQTLKIKLTSMSSEMESVKQSHRMKSEELDGIGKQMKVNEEAYERRVARLDNELERSEEELGKLKQLYSQILRENESVIQEKVDKERAAARSKGESEDMRSKLDRVLADLEAYKVERQQMITAHQNRIEDLRESFKRKVAEADKWPKKMEETLEKERNKHRAELSALESGMKENFVMEMEIEKQKHQKLVDSLSNDSKSEIARLKSQLRSQAANQSELEALKRQVETAKADALGTEARLRSEIENLKSIIANLEHRLGKLDPGDKEYMLSLKSQLSDKERSLEDSSDKIRSQEAEIVSFKEQLRVLQDTVSRECEERMELIDALGEAREQLLILKKPSAGYPSSRNPSPKLPASLPAKTTSLRESAARPSSPAASLSSVQSASKEELMLFKKSNQNSARRPSNSTASTSSSAGSDKRAPSKIINGNSKTLNFHKDNAQSKPLQELKSMDSAQRKRIAAILSRNKQ